MRAVLQRVSRASVFIDNEIVGKIGCGLLVFLGVEVRDTDKDIIWLADKIIHLRIFDDDNDQMNRSLKDIQGELLVVSQFTLLGDCRKGRRPSWHSAAPPDKARQLYLDFLKQCRINGFPPQCGQFQAMMDVSLTNDGPVTLLLDSRKTF